MPMRTRRASRLHAEVEESVGTAAERAFSLFLTNDVALPELAARARAPADLRTLMSLLQVSKATAAAVRTTCRGKLALQLGSIWTGQSSYGHKFPAGEPTEDVYVDGRQVYDATERGDEVLRWVCLQYVDLVGALTLGPPWSSLEPMFLQAWQLARAIRPAEAGVLRSLEVEFDYSYRGLPLVLELPPPSSLTELVMRDLLREEDHPRARASLAALTNLERLTLRSCNTEGGDRCHTAEYLASATKDLSKLTFLSLEQMQQSGDTSWIADLSSSLRELRLHLFYTSWFAGGVWDDSGANGTVPLDFRHLTRLTSLTVKGKQEGGLMERMQLPASLRELDVPRCESIAPLAATPGLVRLSVRHIAPSAPTFGKLADHVPGLTEASFGFSRLADAKAALADCSRLQLQSLKLTARGGTLAMTDLLTSIGQQLGLTSLLLRGASGEMRFYSAQREREQATLDCAQLATQLRQLTRLATLGLQWLSPVPAGKERLQALAGALAGLPQLRQLVHDGGDDVWRGVAEAVAAANPRVQCVTHV